MGRRQFAPTIPQQDQPLLSQTILPRQIRLDTPRPAGLEPGPFRQSAARPAEIRLEWNGRTQGNPPGWSPDRPVKARLARRRLGWNGTAGPRETLRARARAVPSKRDSPGGD